MAAVILGGLVTTTVLNLDDARSQPSAAATMPVGGKVLVWDLPLRVFHWLLDASFAGAWLAAEDEQWRLRT